VERADNPIFRKLDQHQGDTQSEYPTPDGHADAGGSRGQSRLGYSTRHCGTRFAFPVPLESEAAGTREPFAGRPPKPRVAREGKMARLFVCDKQGAITADIEASESVLRSALEDEQADAVVRCAVLMALSALVEGGTWPAAALRSMADFMAAMRDELQAEQLF